MSSSIAPGSPSGQSSGDLVPLVSQQPFTRNVALNSPSNGQEPDPVDSLGLDRLTISLGQRPRKSSGARKIKGIPKGQYDCAAYTEAGEPCKNSSPNDLYLSGKVPFYCDMHSPDEDSSRLRCIVINAGNHKQCYCGCYKVLHVEESEESYICPGHKRYNVLQGHIFRVGKSAVELQRYLITSEVATDGAGPVAEPSALPIEVPSSPESSSSAMSSPIQRINRNDILVTVKGNEVLVMSNRTFDDLTVDLRPLVKGRVRQLIVDFFLLLSTDENGSRISVGVGHTSYFGKSLKGKNLNGKNNGRDNLAKGYVYALLFLPSDDGRHWMMDASKQVAGKSVALKIGYSATPVNRIEHHFKHCSISKERSQTFPSQDGRGPLPFGHLFEKIVHEILVAHQHDIWCKCKATHTEMFWFDRVSGDPSGTVSYDVALALLAPILNKWVDAIRELEGVRSLLGY